MPPRPVGPGFFRGTTDIVVNNVGQDLIASALMPDDCFQWAMGCGHMLHHFAGTQILDAALSLA